MTAEEILKEYEELADEVDQLYVELARFFQAKKTDPNIAALAMHDLYTDIQKNSGLDLALGDARKALKDAKEKESTSEVMH